LRIAQPDYGYITNFGKAHWKDLVAVAGVIEGKSEMYKHLSQNDKFVL
jgi:UDP-N-acetylmuramoyl-tripeptide--D-alanyl-D-alanine ligase